MKSHRHRPDPPGRCYDRGICGPAGPEYAFLAWLPGRPDGGQLARAGNGQLPEVPALYAV